MTGGMCNSCPYLYSSPIYLQTLAWMYTYLTLLLFYGGQNDELTVLWIWFEMNIETVFFNNGLEHYSSEDTGIVKMFKKWYDIVPVQKWKWNLT